MPQGIRGVLKWISDEYKPVGGIYVTENGLAATEHDLEMAQSDKTRIEFYRGYLGAVRDSIRDGVDVRGYFLWSLMDNFEWAWGYEKRFG